MHRMTVFGLLIHPQQCKVTVFIFFFTNLFYPFMDFRPLLHLIYKVITKAQRNKDVTNYTVLFNRKNWENLFTKYHKQMCTYTYKKLRHKYNLAK